jgi:membrane-bound lytic murein transglycosylase D
MPFEPKMEQYVHYMELGCIIRIYTGKFLAMTNCIHRLVQSSYIVYIGARRFRKDMKQILILAFAFTMLTATGCQMASNGNHSASDLDSASEPNGDEIYLLYPQLLVLQKKYDAAEAYYYLGDLRSAYRHSEQLYMDIEEMLAGSLDQYVCDHLDVMLEKSIDLLDLIDREEMERDWQTHMMAVMDSIAVNHVVEEEIEIVYNWRTEHWIDYFGGKGRRHYARWLDRTAKYRDIIIPILVENDIPRDLLFLAVIESGLNLNARSRVKATGPWQFMAGTGRLFGLRINWWIDERKDIIASTYAAAHYLKHLHNLFGNWPLALAAYNSGEYRVAYAISKQKTDDYWKLNLPSQTRWFVPKYMAALAIGRNPDKYGFKRPNADPLEFDVIRIDKSTDLRVIAKYAGCTYRTIQELNPAMKRWATPPGMVVELKVPIGSGDKVLAALEDIPPEERLSWHKHRVKKGETLSQIATRYEISTRELKRINGIKNVHKIRVGNILLIPVKDADMVAKASSEPKYREEPNLPDKITMRKYKAPTGKKKIVYKVKPNDTLSEIAERYHVGLSKLRRWNDLRYTSHIRPGQNLVIYVSPQSNVPAEEVSSIPDGQVKDGKKLVYHIVKSGETLTSISRRYNKRISEILAWNTGIHKDRLYPGERIAIWIEAD